MYFGQFLLAKRVVSPTHLLEAIDVQRRASPYIGSLAVREGVMTIPQVLSVLDQLAGVGSEGAHFCEVAVERGYIDSDARDRLLALKRMSVEPLGEILVDAGVLSRAEMTDLLREFLRVHKSKASKNTHDVIAKDFI